MKRKILIMIVLLLVAFGLKGFAEIDLKEAENSYDKIIVGTSGDYGLYTYVDENGQLTGFDIEVWKEIGKILEKEIVFIKDDFTDLFFMMDTGKIDAIANQITINDNRINKYYFSNPYAYNEAQIVIKKDSKSIEGLNDLKGKTVGIVSSSCFEDALREYDFNNEIKIQSYNLYIDALKDLSTGNVDAVLDDRLAANKIINELNLDLKLASNPVELIENGFPFAKKTANEIILKDVNKAIDSMRADGTLRDLSLKWFSKDITNKNTIE